VDKDALKLLAAVVEKLSGKRPDESVSWEEVKRAAEVQDFEKAARTLERYSLIIYESSYSVYGRDCPLLLDAYSDLRAKLRDLLR
jgi:glucose-6-phosphate-specific signal transduction histidine kinase